MVRRRSLLPALGALLALALAPASASAQDVTPPTNLTPTPPTGWIDGDYQVTLDASDDPPGVVASMEWRVDGGAEQPALPGEQATVSGDGSHTLETRAIDDSDNASAWRPDTVRIDTSDPVDITNPGTSAWRPGPVDVTIAGIDGVSDIAHVEWQLDGGLPQSGPNASVVPIAADGVHTLSTRVVDLAGNASSWHDHTIRIDTVTPLDDTAAPAGWQTDPLVVSVTGSDAHSGIGLVRWRVDGGLPQFGFAPSLVTISADGEHTLLTQVQDNVGHASGWKTHTIRIDTTAPANHTPTADPGWRAAPYAVMVSGADDGSGLAQVEWRVDGGPVTAGASPTQATVSGNGTHTLETRAVDVAGNASAWRSESVRIDNVVPTNTTAAPTGPVPNPYQVAVTGTDAHAGVAHVEWRVDGGAIQSGPFGSQATVSGNGMHTLETRVVDGAGNASAWRSDEVEIDITLNADSTPPTDTTTTVTAGWRTAAVNLTLAATDSGAGVERLEWRLDGAPVQTHFGDSKALTIADEGVHELETRAWDFAGNDSAWRSQTIRIDLTVPTDAITIGAGWQAQRTFTAAGTDALSGIDEIEYRIDGGAVQVAADGAAVDLGADGVFAVAHRVLDHAGHASPWKTDTLRIDTVAPVNTSAAPESGWQAAAVEPALAGTDDRSGLEKMQWRVDGGPIQDGTPARVDTDGVHALASRAVDKAGNVSAWRTETVRVDVTAPVNDTPAAPEGWRATPYTVEIAGSDGAGSGMVAIERQLDEDAVSGDAEVTVAGDGVHTLRSRIVDAVGHRSAWRVDTIRIDSADPQLAVSCPSGWSSQPVACTVAADGGPSGLSSLTVTRDGGAAEAVAAGAAVTVDGDGEHAIAAAAVDGAGNHGSATATVRVDRSAPRVELACAGQACHIAGADDVSGVASIAYSIDGGAWQAPAADGSFTVAAGRVVARAVDLAGNAAGTAPVEVAAPPEGTPTARTRSASRPVYLRGRSGASAMIGALRARRDASGKVSVDLRPLALGRGKFRMKLRIEAGKRKRTVTRTVRTRRGGTSPRLRARLSGATKRCTVTLRVKRKAGGGWRAHAGGRLVLAP
jgi:Big-like domain-containing protein